MPNAAGELIGYSDTWSAAPGDTVRFHVSASEAYRVRLVRLLHGSEDPAGPGFREEVIPNQPELAPGEGVQRARAGSCVLVEEPPSLSRLEGCTIAVWFWPTLLRDRRQGLLSCGDLAQDGAWRLVLDEGRLRFDLADGGTSVSVAADTPVRERRWYFACAVIDIRERALTLWQSPISGDAVRVQAQMPQNWAIGECRPLLIGAEGPGPDGAQSWTASHFNGKLDDPMIFGRALSDAAVEGIRDAEDRNAFDQEDLVADWDFSQDMDTDRVADRGPGKHHGRLINLPARAMTGRLWDGRYLDPRLAPDQWSAIHFHEDDLGDAAWDPSFELEVPSDLPSGVYAARLRTEAGLEDHIPFVVRPRRGGESPAALLLPTLTYLAYANNRFDPEFGTLGITGKTPRPSAPDEWLADHPEVAASVYDRHADGSGFCYSSRLRPIPNLRPRVVEWSTGLPRHLAADLYIVDWLHHAGIDFDVITDEDLDEHGHELLAPYRVVLTGTHPEYVTGNELNALDEYIHHGGHLMYLGGNGFYWVTGLERPRRSYMEIRRGYAAARGWESHSGEVHLSTTGEPGGLWRHRGRPPNALTGVGFAAQGFGISAPGYRRSAASYEPEFQWIFDGVKDEIVGDFGLHMGGAAGDEIDRYDADRDSPPDTTVLASAVDYPDVYQPALEDVEIVTPHLCRPGNPLVRADMTYRELPGGGAVFAASAISWAGSLSHDDYSNSVSRITQNVLRRFLG